MVRAYETCGGKLDDCTTYKRRPDPVQFMQQLRAQFEQCQLHEAELEVYWWNPQNKLPQHIGILNADLTRIVHTWYGIRKVTDSPRDELWLERSLSGWRLKEALWQR